MEKKIFVERMLETENLTDELEDRDANWLLDWGIGKLDELLGNVRDPELAGAIVNRLMAVMRKVNRIAGSYARKEPADLAEDLKVLQDLCTEAFGHPPQPVEKDSPQDFEKLAISLIKQPPRQVVEILCQTCGPTG